MAQLESRYARAFLDVVTAKKLATAEIDQQLGDFEATWDASPELARFFQNPAVAEAAKIEFLDRLNKKLKLDPPVRNLIAVLIHNERIGQIHEVAAAYRAELEERMGIRQAEIVTARELTAEERRSLVAGVGRLAGGEVQAKFTLDKSLLGGAVVRIGSTVYDGSVRGRLERLKEALVEG
jgi:F-type H+-transporting ATPase subunit delta